VTVGDGSLAQWSADRARIPEPDALVVATGISKRFAAYHRKATSLKERLIRREEAAADVFWALRDVDIVIRRGETVGLTGANGSGKSTLLKVLSGILRPNEGRVMVHGRVASLLELGAGFDGELTGRENVYLNAALLGISRQRTESLFEQILGFSELEDFIDTPVKHYSSGMYVRLGFAIAVHVDPDILIIDEVLAVGDAAFQRKCLDRIREFQNQGKTILFVSHSSAQITSLCTRAVLLDKGRVVFDGEARQTVDRLHELLGVDNVERRHAGTCRIAAAVLVDPASGTAPEAFQAGSGALLMADLEWLRRSPIQGCAIEVDLMSGGEVVATVEPRRLVLPADEPNTSGGRTSIRWQIRELPDRAGVMTLRLRVLGDGSHLAQAEISDILIRSESLPRVEGTAWVLERLSIDHS
jgi:ABC-2 type transport system ATP-binding protein